MNNSESTKAPRILGVFAHPDDEVFCAGGTFAKYSAEGAEIMIVSATKGDAGQIRDAAIATRRTLGNVRAQELQESCRQLGVQHGVCLNYGDGTLKDLDLQVLVEDVTRIVRTFQPDIVITFDEDGAYGHPDHIAISHATTQACLQAGNPEHFPSQIENGLTVHTPARLYHSYFPHNRTFMLNELANWLLQAQQKHGATTDFARALLLFAEETTLLRYSSDYIDINWYPAGFYIIEQGEAAKDLYLILSGSAQAIHEDADGTLQPLSTMSVGEFFGERGVGLQARRAAHVVAMDDVTCLVFSSNHPIAFAGRGEDANITGADGSGAHEHSAATTSIDVNDYVGQKIAAMAAHRTQYPITPDMFPMSMLCRLLGQEYFIRVLPQPKMEHRLI